MCNCMSEINKKLREHNTMISPVIFFNGQPSRPEIVVEKINKSVRGKAMGIMIRYCPFCGEKYAAEQPLAPDGATCPACGTDAAGYETCPKCGFDPRPAGKA